MEIIIAFINKNPLLLLLTKFQNSFPKTSVLRISTLKSADQIMPKNTVKKPFSLQAFQNKYNNLSFK